MTSALVNLNGPSGSHPLMADLEAVGIHVLGSVAERGKLLQEVLRQAPDLLICDDPHPGEELFNVLQTLGEAAPCPVIVFTHDGDAGSIRRATEAGVHAYVVNGYGQQRLRALIHVAQARFSREQALRAQMRDISTRFEERKMVDRAKGILMRARQVSDDDAFQMLRTASMHSNQRLGQVSAHIIHSARFAEDVNRAGQLRMLSQKLVKLALLQLAGLQAAQVKEQLKASVLRVDTTIAALQKSLSQPTFGDLLAQVVLAWTRLKQALQNAPGSREMAHVDELAERLLQEAERLTGALENAGAVPPLQVLNIAGRQRMLSQRFAKYALLEGAGDPLASQRGAAGMDESRAAFEKALRYLNTIPLSSPDIRSALDAATACWERLVAEASPGFQSAAPQLERLETLALASEELLGIFEQLSAHYERSMQMLVG